MMLKFYYEEKEDMLIHWWRINYLCLKTKAKRISDATKAWIAISKIQIILFNQFGQKPAAWKLKRFLKEELKF